MGSPWPGIPKWTYNMWQIIGFYITYVQSMVDIKEARMQLYIDDLIGAIPATPARGE